MGNKGVLVKQRVQKNVRLVLAFVAGLLMLASMPSLSASAAETTANTLKVTPVRSDIQIAAGETKTVQVTVTNLTGGQIRVRPIANDFIAGDERGTPALILDAKDFAPTHSLKRFMKPIADVIIPAKQSKVVDVVITVPKDAQTGGYFGAVRFAPTTPDGGGQVNLSGSVASLILMTVPGPVTERLNLTNFDIQQNGQTNWQFRTPDSLQLAFRMENKGSVQEGPFGKISVKNGDKVVYSVDFNNQNPRDMILPDSARRWDIPLEKIEAFGYYTVSATFTYGQKNQTIEATKTFWVVPLAYLIGALVGLVVLILLIIFIIWKIVHRARGGGRMRMGRR